MLFKFLLSINSMILQSGITNEQAQILKNQQDQLELSKLTTILSIALISILALLTISLFKNNRLQNEIKRLKQGN